MTRRKVPTAERARAVGIAAVSSIAEASRQTGYSQAGIHKWFHSPEYEELRNRNKDVREQEWQVGIELAFRRAVELLAQTDDPVKAATTGAILYDKLALSSGNVTSRSESRKWTDDLDDNEKRRLRDWIDSLDSATAEGSESPAAVTD